jgi:hypothetical protein
MPLAQDAHLRLVHPIHSNQFTNMALIN